MIVCYIYCDVYVFGWQMILIILEFHCGMKSVKLIENLGAWSFWDLFLIFIGFVQTHAQSVLIIPL